MASMIQTMRPVHLIPRASLRGEAPKPAQPDPTLKKMSAKRAKKSQPDQAIGGM